MAWPTTFSALAGGNQPLALFDAMFNQIAAMVAIPCTTSGTNAIVATPIGGAPALSAYSNYNLFSFKAPANSTGTVTFKFNTLSTLPTYKRDGTTVVGSGDIVSGRPYIAMFDSSLNGGGGGFYIMESTLSTAAVAANLNVFNPGPRLSFATATPVMTTNVAGATQHFYTPYLSGRFVPFYDGTNITMQDVGGELVQAANDATKSPAATAASSVYYVFAWNDGGVYRATRGPAWTNDTTPGAGNALTLQNGVWLNTSIITNGPAALRGTLVGAIRSNAGATFDWTFGAANTPAWFACWNVFNRVAFGTMEWDTTASWTYSTAAYRQARASANNQLLALNGLSIDSVQIDVMTSSSNDSGGGRGPGIGINSTTVNSAQLRGKPGGTSLNIPASARYTGVAPIGWNKYAWLESGDGTATTTWLGNDGTAFAQSGISGVFWQ